MAKVIKTTLDKALKFNHLGDGSFISDENDKNTYSNVTKEFLYEYFANSEVVDAMLRGEPFFTWYDDGGAGGESQRCFLIDTYSNGFNNEFHYHVCDFYGSILSIRIHCNNDGTYTFYLVNYDIEDKLKDCLRLYNS